ncbi:glycoprotein 3-alpha-L-fucosyltransferase A-like [Contarinia nasturtii]|uniref:glycoprotein 3-alpha-L-fucosyltransferase A-like n=1 Tax=Contarinia nasturtii TaxID=265458 RepID=UPI0012D3DCB9|nr:glycoprotein 3-alpha-L-fucosyltransferase A-like [Contarinia nasturtii]
MLPPNINISPVNNWSLSNLIKKRVFIYLVLFSIVGRILWSSKKPSSTKFSGENVVIKPREKPWFFKDGKAPAVRAKYSEELGRHDAKIMPWQDPSDRFENQLMFIPPNYDEKKVEKNKTILFYNGDEGWWHVFDQWETWFTNKKCPVNRCRFTKNRNESDTAAFILFSGQHMAQNLTKQPHQVYGFYRLESPVHWTTKFTSSIIYNWTITYRHDSTFPIPYFKWLYFDPQIKQMKQTRYYALNKTKKVAMIVSNCEPHNDRQIYVEKLQKYIDVDIYGACGTKQCSKNSNGNQEDECWDLISREYKFYLSFENSHCWDYITEKAYRNALIHNALPVVLGARREDYERQLPLNSFIYVEDFATVKDLADYLHKVDQDDDLYNSYFQWKGTGEILDKFELLWCRVCALLHDEDTMNTSHWYEDINKWWFDPKSMRSGFWRDTN